MRKITTLLVMAIVAISGTAYAQYSSDALRFSQNDYGSTARFKGMGDAQIGVGGDLSSLGGNPAGLGLFTKSEFNFTPGFNNISTNASYLGQSGNTSKSVPNIGQAGVAFYLPTYKMSGGNTNKGIVSLVVGIGYNRVADYNNEFNFSGTNPNNSIADYFAELAGSTAPGSLSSTSLENWAYQDFLISYDNGGYYYPETYVNNTQSVSEFRKGSTSELNFAAALNISNQFYVGANIGIVNTNYTRDALFTESGLARAYDANGNLTGGDANYKLLYSQNQNTSGSGINGRLGVIFRPVPEFRFGATIQTPTWMDIEDSYTERLNNTATAFGTDNAHTYDFQYKLKTPLKGSVGASYIIGGTALITADVDYIDYSSTRLSDPYTNDYELINNNNSTIRQKYKEAVNFRVGGEYKYNNLNFRAGYGLNGSPYKANKDLYAQTYTGGLGYRINNYYIDLAYQHVQEENLFSTYVLADYSEPVANLSTAKDNIFFTVGVRF